MEDIQEKIDNFCIDCQRWTRQTYHHTNRVDGDLVYICEVCGCENSVFPEKFVVNRDKSDDVDIDIRAIEQNYSVEEFQEHIKEINTKK